MDFMICKAMIFIRLMESIHFLKDSVDFLEDSVDFLEKIPLISFRVLVIASRILQISLRILLIALILPPGLANTHERRPYGPSVWFWHPSRSPCSGRESMIGRCGKFLQGKFHFCGGYKLEVNCMRGVRIWACLVGVLNCRACQQDLRCTRRSLGSEVAAARFYGMDPTRAFHGKIGNGIIARGAT